MPNKGQKVAKRQGQLRDRKRRGPGRASTQNFEVGPSVSTTTLDDENDNAVALAAVAEGIPAPTRRRRSRQEVEDQGSPAYQYLGKELRHIGLITLVILVILIATTFTLGGAI